MGILIRIIISGAAAIALLNYAPWVAFLFKSVLQTQWTGTVASFQYLVLLLINWVAAFIAITLLAFVFKRG